ncbi:thiol-activated cytolysin family protein [Flavobacteriaceae bacterium KMM 6898]|nr:thiol-activated cytolysin family protein [Flavobacteriaceae bacterium KMM 6898]
METTIKFSKKIILILAIFLISQCSSDPTSDNEATVDPEVASINAYFNNIPDWDNSSDPALPDKTLDDIIVFEQVNIPYKCPTVEKNLVASQEKIVSVGTNQGKIWPGALIEGNSLEPGDIKLITTDHRAPITINSDLVINNSFREIDNPNSVTVQQAIVEMQIESGNMEEGNQAGAGQMNFKIEESSSFSQSMLSMGVSAGFTEPQSQVGIEGSTNVSKSRDAKTHTIMARFVQEKFTVRLADDLIPTSADFFKEGTTLSDIKSLESAGKLGEGNIPLYIESVTYGRILLFSMTSTSVSTASELSGSLEASFADYVEGGANLDDTQKEILENSSTKIYSAGGSEDGANAAVASLDWSQFFVAAPVATAVPISFTARTLNGNRVKVKLNSNIMYEQRQDCKEPSGYDITVNLEKVELIKGICSCVYTSYLNQDGKTIPSIIDANLVFIKYPGPGSGGSIPFQSNKGDNAVPSFKVTSGFCTGASVIVSPLAGCAIQNLVKDQARTFRWPYADLKTNAKTTFNHTITEGVFNVKTLRFDYSVFKSPIW